MIKHYTFKDLEEHMAEYDEIVRQLIEGVTDEEAKVLLKQERRLNRIGRKIRTGCIKMKRGKKLTTISQGLNILAKDPCNLKGGKPCDSCTGYYIKKSTMCKTYEKEYPKTSYFMCKANHPWRIKCKDRINSKDLAKLLRD